MYPRLTITAPAKVNLALSVGPRDADSGLHPISSWMITVDLCDELELTRLDAGTLSRYAILWHEDARCPSDIDWSIRDDLAVRAHVALERHLGRSLPLQAAVRKRIPVGGGLGGGSADAASMLIGCRALFDLDGEVTDADLLAIAAKLGSDVPFLVHGGSAIVEGTGDVINAHETLPDCHLVLILTDASCPTGPIYSAFDGRGEAVLRPDAVRSLAEGSGSPFNDLAPAALDHAPRLAEGKQAIEALVGRDAHVSGSGATLFIQCDSQVEAEAIAEAVSDQLELAALVASPIRRSMHQETTTS